MEEDRLSSRSRLLALVACLFVVQTVCAQDTEPPNVLSFDFDPKAVDTSTASQEITFTARLTDDLSGVDRSTQLRFRSPSGNQFTGGCFDLVSGTVLDGTYETTITLPQYSESGTWHLEYFLLLDDVGNHKDLSEDDVSALGFPTEFEVTSNSDTEPPDVLDFDFDPKAVDTSTSSQDITFTAHLTDDLSGVDRSTQLRFRSPSGNQFTGGCFDLVSGTVLDGTYETTITLPQYSESGTWHLEYFLLLDDVGNRKDLSEDDVSALGFPTTFRNGHIGTLSISGMKFNDTNNNTVKDPDESGLSGWRIELLFDGEVIDTIETAVDGTYSFDYLAPGSYTVREVRQAGWIQTYPPSGSHSVNLVDADSTGNDFGNHQIAASEDTEPPDVLSFDFDPKAVDTSASSQEITVTTRLTDDLSGFSSATVRFESPSDSQSASVSLSSLDRISGDELNGVYEDKMTLPQYSEPGTWKLDYISFRDNVGNRKQLFEDDVAALGFPTEFEVESVGDAEPPDILSFDFDPKAVDTSTSSQEITAATRLTDDLSGLSSASVRFKSPSGGQSASVSLSPNDRISGDELDGVYEDEMTLPRYSEPGTWKLDYISLSDNVENRKRLSGDDAAAFGFPTTFRNGHSGALSISGMKFNDLNNNSAKDPDESGLPGWTIELLLDGEVIDTIEPPSDGTYSFDHLAPGSYTVREVRQAGWVQTYPPGGSHSVNLVDADSTGNDFGNHQIMSEDTEPPDILSFDFDPRAINTSTLSQEITFTTRLTDDLSGLDRAQARFESPSESQSVSVSFTSSDRISGNELDGVYSDSMTLPQYSEPGTWELDYVSLYDEVGNRKQLSKDDMNMLNKVLRFARMVDGQIIINTKT